MIALFLIFGLATPPQPAVDLMLGAIDVVISPMLIAEVGLTEDYAIAVATDPAQRRYMRVRATGAVGIFGSPRARSVLLDLARHDSDFEVRVQAVTSLAHWFAEDAPGQLNAELMGIADGAPGGLQRIIIRRVQQISEAWISPDTTRSHRPPAHTPVVPAR